ARADYRAIPATIFTDPQVATVGAVEGRIARWELTSTPRLSTYERPKRPGFLKVAADPERRILRGAVAVGPEAGEWLQQLTLAIHDASSGAMYAAAASEWHGSAVWRSDDLGETWALSSEGIGYGDDDPRKVSKVSSLAARNGRVLVGVEAPGIFQSSDGGETWSLLTTLSGQPGSELWDDPANQPPGHLGISALMLDG